MHNNKKTIITTNSANISKNITNPWTSISWSNTILKCDENYLCKSIRGKTFVSICDYRAYINRHDLPGNPDNIELTFDALPEPFSGDKESQVYCLNINPGKPDPLFGYNQDKTQFLYESLWKKILTHSIVNTNEKKLVSNNIDIVNSPQIYDHLKNCKKSKSLNGYYIHKGEYWYDRMINPLKKEIYPNELNLFFIEYFPYHSNRAFNFPKYLPSNSYRDYLIEQAIEQEKTIIILRGYDLWLNNKIPIGRMLKNYHKTYILYSNRGLHLSTNKIFKVLPDKEQEILNKLF